MVVLDDFVAVWQLLPWPLQAVASAVLVYFILAVFTAFIVAAAVSGIPGLQDVGRTMYFHSYLTTDSSAVRNQDPAATPGMMFAAIIANPQAVDSFEGCVDVAANSSPIFGPDYDCSCPVSNLAVVNGTISGCSGTTGSPDPAITCDTQAERCLPITYFGTTLVRGFYVFDPMFWSGAILCVYIGKFALAYYSAGQLLRPGG